mgnify:CR=1 FL=1
MPTWPPVPLAPPLPVQIQGNGPANVIQTSPTRLDACTALNGTAAVNNAVTVSVTPPAGQYVYVCGFDFTVSNDATGGVPGVLVKSVIPGPTGGSLVQDALAEEIVALDEIAGPPPTAVGAPVAASDLPAIEREALTVEAIEAPAPVGSSEPATETAEAETAAEPAAEATPPAPEPEPVAVVLTPPDPDRPKRAGWWSRTKAAIGGE